VALSERDRIILRLAVPALGTLAIEPLYVLADTAIVGHLGTAPLGGLALAATVLNVCFWIFNFLAYGTTSRVAFLEGAGDPTAAADIAVQGLWLAMALGSALAVAIAVLARPVASLLGGEGATLDAATTYLRISALGAPLVLLALVANGYLRGVRDTRTPFVVVLVANVFNIVIEVLFVYGLHLGVAGSAWGTVLAQLLAAVWFSGLLASRLRRVGASLQPIRAEIARLLRTGRHLLVRTGSLLASLTLATSVAAHLGPDQLAAHQIAYQVHLFLGLVLDSLAIAAQALIGGSLGAGDVDDARALGWRMVELGLIVGAVIGGAVVVLAPVLPHAFTSSETVARMARNALFVVGILQVPASVVFVLDGVLIGADDTRFQQWANIVAFIVFLPCAAAVLHWPSLGLVGLWCGIGVWLATRMVANLTRFAGSAWAAVAKGRPTNNLRL
jgi:putative MATE family efflux protein